MQNTVDPEFQQLDLFADSRDVMLRNDVVQALERHDAGAARTAWLGLTQAFPGEPNAQPFDALIRALEQHDDTPFVNHEQLQGERHALTLNLTVSAHRALGPVAGDIWLLPIWQSLAARSQRLPFDRHRVDGHAAALWLRGERWAEAAAAVERIESWRRIPAPLAWMLEAQCRMGRLDASWPLLAELAWLASGQLEATLQRLGDPLLVRLLKKFDAAFAATSDIEDLSWFPAWVLIDTSALAPHLALAWPSQQTAGERAMRLLLELLGLERRGRHDELMRRRRHLRELSAPLYAAYMSSR